MADTISFQNLVDYAEGRLSAAERAAVAAQALADPAIAAELAQVQKLIALMRADATQAEDAPTHVINRAARLLRQRKATRPERPSLTRRLIAALTFDSAVSPAFGLRSGGTQTRQLLLTAEGIDLDLRIAPSGAGFAVSGQVLGPESPGEVTLTGDDISAHAALNDLGEFALTTVPAGRYLLTVRQDAVEIVVPELELGASNTNDRQTTTR